MCLTSVELTNKLLLCVKGDFEGFDINSCLPILGIVYMTTTSPISDEIL